jgi:hypothetical protein
LKTPFPPDSFLISKAISWNDKDANDGLKV